ncbi:hypothetical protein STEG23_029649 [Scotinomys teguina]
MSDTLVCDQHEKEQKRGVSVLGPFQREHAALIFQRTEMVPFPLRPQILVRMLGFNPVVLNLWISTPGGRMTLSQAPLKTVEDTDTYIMIQNKPDRSISSNALTPIQVLHKEPDGLRSPANGETYLEPGPTSYPISRGAVAEATYHRLLLVRFTLCAFSVTGMGGQRGVTFACVGVPGPECLLGTANTLSQVLEEEKRERNGQEEGEQEELLHGLEEMCLIAEDATRGAKCQDLHFCGDK